MTTTTNAKLGTYERIAATDVRDGDILWMLGHRCRVANCSSYIDSHTGREVRRYTLTSEPNAAFPNRLPAFAEGEWFGGNSFAIETRELAPAPTT